MAEGDATQQAVQKLRNENTQLEAEIAKMTTKGASDTKALVSTKALAPVQDTGIKVMQFGNPGVHNPAGVNNGSAWCPPSTHRRTLLGGFFTS